MVHHDQNPVLDFGRRRIPRGGAVGAVNSVAEILLCLKRLKSSIRLWNGEGGRQGYLTYIRNFLP